MGHEPRTQALGRSPVQERAKKPYISPPPKPDHNELRRKQYASDPSYAERQRELARNTYRKARPLSPSKLASGLLHAGTLREVTAQDMEYPQTVECFTIPEAAKALGKTELTVKRWIEEDLLPEPVLSDTTRGYRQYSLGELTIVARVLAVHEREFSYYANTHTQTREQIMQQLFGFREHHI